MIFVEEMVGLRVTKKKNELWEWIKVIVIALILAMLLRYFLLTPIVVDGESMMPTLHDNDKMLVNKLSYKIGDPERFDIVVFHAPEGKDYIKRVIGLPGDKIEYKNDTLYVNGKALEEPYLEDYKLQIIDPPLTEPFTLKEVTGQETVPEGHLFVMGDNRRVSKDSRHIGVISLDEVIGTTKMVIWPLENLRMVE